MTDLQETSDEARGVYLLVVCLGLRSRDAQHYVTTEKAGTFSYSSVTRQSLFILSNPTLLLSFLL